MATSVLSNLVDDQDILSNERVVDMDPVIKLLQQDLTQFTTLLMKVSSKPAHSSKVEWLEDELFPRLTTLAASAASGDGTISVATDTGAYFRIGDVIRVVSTGECLAVSAAPSTDTVGVIRSIGTVAAASAASGGDLVILSNASAQGATLGTRKVVKRVAAYNYTQIFRHPYGFTNTIAASGLYGGPEPNKERRKKAIEHKRSIEYTLFWGARDFDANGVTGADSEPTTWCGGLVEYISTYINNPAGQMTNAAFEGYMRGGQTNGSQNKVLFAAPLVRQIISGYARDNWVRSSPNEKLWGIDVQGFISGSYGDRVPVIVKRDWNDFSVTSGSGYGSWAFLVDMDAVTLRPLRSTKLLTNRQANDADQITEEYLTELSFQVEWEKKHMIIKNATS